MKKKSVKEGKQTYSQPKDTSFEFIGNIAESEDMEEEYTTYEDIETIDKFPPFDWNANKQLQTLFHFPIFLPQSLLWGLLLLLSNRSNENDLIPPSIAWQTDGAEFDYYGISAFIRVYANDKIVTEGNTVEAKFAYARRNGFTPVVELIYVKELVKFLNQYVIMYFKGDMRDTQVFLPREHCLVHIKVESWQDTMTTTYEMLETLHRKIKQEHELQEDEWSEFSIYALYRPCKEEERILEMIWYLLMQGKLLLFSDSVSLNPSNFSSGVYCFEGLSWGGEYRDCFYYEKDGKCVQKIDLKAKSKAGHILWQLLRYKNIEKTNPSREELLADIKQFNVHNKPHRKATDTLYYVAKVAKKRQSAPVIRKKQRDSFRKAIEFIKAKCMAVGVQIEIENRKNGVYIKRVRFRKKKENWENLLKNTIIPTI